MTENVEYVDEGTYLRQLQQHQPVGFTTGSAYQSPQDKYGSSIITLTNPKDDLYKFELFLRALKKQPDGSLNVIGKPLLNDKGLNSIMASIESLVHSMNTYQKFLKKMLKDSKNTQNS